jgi:hypothetical protein
MFQDGADELAGASRPRPNVIFGVEVQVDVRHATLAKSVIVLRTLSKGPNSRPWSARKDSRADHTFFTVATFCLISAALHLIDFHV